MKASLRNFPSGPLSGMAWLFTVKEALHHADDTISHLIFVNRRIKEVAGWLVTATTLPHYIVDV